MIFYPLEHINIKTLFSTAYRAPSINELYLDYTTMKGKMIRMDTVSWYPGHEYNLEPEKVYTVDIGANYTNDNVQFGVNGYYSRLMNLIGERPIFADYSVNLRDNTGEFTIFGLECEGKYYVTERILLVGSMLYQHSRDKHTGAINVNPTPNFSAKGGLSYRSTFGLTLSAFNEYLQELDEKYWSSLNEPITYHNITNVHRCYDFNKLFEYSFAKELSLVFNVDNLFDDVILLPCWGPNTRANVPVNQGRTIYSGFEVRF